VGICAIYKTFTIAIDRLLSKFYMNLFQLNKNSILSIPFKKAVANLIFWQSNCN